MIMALLFRDDVFFIDQFLSLTHFLVQIYLSLQDEHRQCSTTADFANSHTFQASEAQIILRWLLCFESQMQPTDSIMFKMCRSWSEMSLQRIKTNGQASSILEKTHKIFMHDSVLGFGELQCSLS